MGYSTGVAVGIATGTMINGQLMRGSGGGHSSDPNDNNDDKKYFMKSCSRDLFVGFVSTGIIGIGFGTLSFLALPPAAKRQAITMVKNPGFRDKLFDFSLGATIFSAGISGFFGTTSLFCWTCYKVDKFFTECPKFLRNKKKDANDKY